ncbi:alpha/beta fold hydrolase [Massilia niabensis]|uniref:Alpha/beta fold hydrolase n=1 Tax=Massilia niabensis TaxID=544910 RepID=A0ABW0L824_9BURK
MRPVLLPIKQRVEAAGQTVEYILAGRGGPGVVLVNGAGGPVEGWYKVFGELAEERCIFAYNRAGIGGSGKPTAPQTAGHMVETLRAALASIGVPQPYVLVGHSLGGLVVNLFARLYPGEVAAAVMIEATTPEDVRILPQYEGALQRWLKTLGTRLAPPHPWAETEHVETTLSQLEAAPSFPAIPLHVVSGARYAMQWATPKPQSEARARHQRQLVGLSPFGKQVVANRSGHFPQFSEPELVRATINAAACDAMAHWTHGAA